LGQVLAARKPKPVMAANSTLPETLLRQHLLGPVALIVLILVLTLFGLLFRRTPPPQTALEPVPEARLSDEQITQSFLAAIPRITRQLNLEIATSTQTEVFEGTQGKTALWGALGLGTNLVQIHLPVTYRYHACLREPWKLEVRGKVLVHRQESMSFLGFPVIRYIDVDDSEEVVPHYAMSGGTLIALAAGEIVMFEHAVLGPVDPQFGQSPAASVLRVVREKPIARVDDQTLILADQAEKAIAQLKSDVNDLLAGKGPAEKTAELARLLTEGTWTHDYPHGRGLRRALRVGR
jgi:hypothetical protein